MILYNMLFGANPHAAVLLAILDLTADKCGRFRDCYPSENGTEILVYTRNGGGNRETYMPDFSKHPQYVSDEDDDFDCTYATIKFRTPAEAVDLVKDLADKTNNTQPAERWKQLLADMDAKKDSASVARAMEIGKKILGAILDDKGGDAKTPDGSVTIKKL